MPERKLHLVSAYWKPMPNSGKHHTKVEMQSKFGVEDKVLYHCPVLECDFHKHYGVELSENEVGTGTVWCCGDGRGVDKDGSTEVH